MKSSRILLGIFIISLSFNIICGQEVDLQWGSINTNSIIIDLPAHYTVNLTAGTNASLNQTMRVSRTIHGIRLRGINSIGASAEIISGGVNFNFVTFMLSRNSNYFYFIAEAYENSTSGVESTTLVPTTPNPERVLQEWGVVNSASLALNPKTYYSASSILGQIVQRDVSINVPKVIHGIRVISYNDTAARAEIIDGGINSNFTTIRVFGRAYYLSFSVELFENGMSTTPSQTTTIASTTLISTTPIPEKRVEEWGIFEDYQLLDEKAFRSYPPLWSTANKNATIPVNGVIRGIRLTSLNYTNGLYELIDGGLEKDFVTFNFKGAQAGLPYDFSVEIYGNTAVTMKMSIILIIISSVLVALFK